MNKWYVKDKLKNWKKKE